MWPEWETDPQGGLAGALRDAEDHVRATYRRHGLPDVLAGWYARQMIERVITPPPMIAPSLYPRLRALPVPPVADRSPDRPLTTAAAVCCNNDPDWQAILARLERWLPRPAAAV